MPLCRKQKRLFVDRTGCPVERDVSYCLSTGQQERLWTGQHQCQRALNSCPSTRKQETPHMEKTVLYPESSERFSVYRKTTKAIWWQDSIISRRLSVLALLPESSEDGLVTGQFRTQRALNSCPFTGKQQRLFGDRTASCPEGCQLLLSSSFSPFYWKYVSNLTFYAQSTSTAVHLKSVHISSIRLIVKLSR